MKEYKQSNRNFKLCEGLVDAAKRRRIKSQRAASKMKRDDLNKRNYEHRRID